MIPEPPLKPEKLPTQPVLRPEPDFHSLLNYDPRTGRITWRAGTPGVRAGRVAGNPISSGYLQISVKGRDYRASRLAWFLFHGRFPVGQIDHINGHRMDNSIKNLREATPRQNAQNMKRHREGKLVGVYRRVRKHRVSYEADIWVNKKSFHLGTFSTEWLAHKAYLKALSSLGEEHVSAI